MDSGREPGRTAVRRVPLAVLAVVVAGSLAGCGGDHTADAGADTRWAAGITPEWMSGHMGLDVPATARSVRAAYKVTSRFDTGLPHLHPVEAEAEAYLRKHPPSGRWLTPTAAQPDTPRSDFTHLGLPEPETFEEGVRYGFVCPGTEPYDASDGNCTRLYAHAYAPDRTRIYLRAHFEPGVGPLPTAS
ncbi:hypothetical protein LT493_19315 [Streptomyces tricolor]|nr:hypothetical protein [Streptomyces tricolor]